MCRIVYYVYYIFLYFISYYLQMLNSSEPVVQHAGLLEHAVPPHLAVRTLVCHTNGAGQVMESRM